MFEEQLKLCVRSIAPVFHKYKASLLKSLSVTILGRTLSSRCRVRKWKSEGHTVSTGCHEVEHANNTVTRKRAYLKGRKWHLDFWDQFRRGISISLKESRVVFFSSSFLEIWYGISQSFNEFRYPLYKISFITIVMNS